MQPFHCICLHWVLLGLECCSLVQGKYLFFLSCMLIPNCQELWDWKKDWVLSDSWVHPEYVCFTCVDAVLSSSSKLPDHNDGSKSEAPTRKCIVEQIAQNSRLPAFKKLPTSPKTWNSNVTICPNYSCQLPNAQQGILLWHSHIPRHAQLLPALHRVSHFLLNLLLS